MSLLKQIFSFLFGKSDKICYFYLLLLFMSPLSLAEKKLSSNSKFLKSSSMEQAQLCNDAKECLNQRVETLNGLFYKTKGPNCFSTALYAIGLNDVNTGVDTKEFEFTLDNFCHEVKEPEEGDLGVIFPRVAYSPLHAFVFMDQHTVLEKQGVGDFVPIPVLVNSFSNMYHRVISTDYCRRYSNGHPELCENNLKYYRCKTPKNIQLIPESILIDNFRKKIAILLLEDSFFTKNYFHTLNREFLTLLIKITESLKNYKDKKIKLFLESKLKSTELQMVYLSIDSRIN